MTAPINVVKKVCLVGDPAVGKTSLVRRYVMDKYDDAYMVTIGAKVMRKDVAVQRSGKDYTVSLLLWDVMGQKQFKIIKSVAFQHVTGALIVCDMTRKETLDNVGYWKDSLTEISGPVPLIVLANKFDMKDRIQFGEGEVKDALKQYGIPHFVTSAKTGENVETSFQMLAQACLEKVAD